MGVSVLLSGATGFLGSAIAEELLARSDAKVYVLVRSKEGRTPAERLASLWFERPVLYAALGNRIVPVEGDMEREFLGIADDCYAELASKVGVVIHAAAEVGVNQTEERFWNVNVRGTGNMLEFAKRAAASGGLQRFVHISTTYVAGTRRGTIAEELLGPTSHNSLYERSKYEAERLVNSYGKEFAYSIVRPAQIVGDSSTGFVATFNTLYYPLKRYLRGGMRVIPAAPSLRVNMVPVDFVARLACSAALAEGQPARQVLHAVGRSSELPTLAELVEAVRTWAREQLDVDLPVPIYLPLAGLGALGRSRNLYGSTKVKRRGLLRNLLALAPYFFEDRDYEVSNTRALVGETFPDWCEYLPNLLAFATRRGFLNYTDRTVYEQILMRLRPGASTRLRYFDVKRDGIVEHEGTDVREDILRIAGALIFRGIGRGTRVATIGVNSVRYFALDAAIGLVGATHVPIYYTSSLEDVHSLVLASGVSVLFVGTDRMLDSLDPESLGVEVISISDRRDLRAGIESWESFVSSSAQDASDQTLPYVPLDQTATIRYTSGTTGIPKGVTFSQQQVRWMGEVMPDVLDWRTRMSRKVRYLSFLPMSHVVEGILVAYAPYYILSDIEMYYLNDFPSLAEVLPKVRPNLFFSVPRFYEKVWNQFSSTGPGKFWIALPDGLAKRVLARPLRWVVLRKAGLDRCRQLIVGSAPIGMELLESFRSLGVEIHNAFGVTEAPLITLSRLGANELGSVGQLLPDTQVRLDDEGLVYVRGPQVTRHYDGIEDAVLDGEGWFCTGDLGSYSVGGNLVLAGRKKEILVTSYGKNIAPQKIEVLLKGIDGVSEAMVVADGRPFVTALLWLEDETLRTLEHDASAIDFEALDMAVREVNARLSHPEQVKRWIVCAAPLTVAAGELTPNLKVRRTVVGESRGGLVEALYGSWDWPHVEDDGGKPEGVLHGGKA